MSDCGKPLVLSTAAGKKIIVSTSGWDREKGLPPVVRMCNGSSRGRREQLPPPGEPMNKYVDILYAFAVA